MSLSCTCNEWDGDGWIYYKPSDFKKLYTSKRKRCCSCKELIDIGALCLEFSRSRPPTSDIEERIYGDGPESIIMAPWWMCEKCGEIFLNLEAVGFCVGIGQPMPELLSEYHELTGFVPKKAKA